MHDTKNALIVDPGEASVVIKYLKKHNLKLKTILLTHHHFDHIGGVEELSNTYRCDIYQPNELRIPSYNKSTIVNEADIVKVDFLNLQFKVMALPGHTLSHISYHTDSILFCGDTLFSLGCGRLFEGSPTQMLNSLNKLKKLHSDTLVYCTHEYTLSNLNFSLSLIPDDQNLLKAQQNILDKLENDQPSLPSTLEFEKRCNLFLRTNESKLIHKLCAHSKIQLENEVAVFALLRQLKDEF
jgi:hydroxyacylglutathione hydrolase